MSPVYSLGFGGYLFLECERAFFLQVILLIYIYCYVMFLLDSAILFSLFWP